MTPNIFVIFGMPRTGTTFLYHTLQKHPAIFLPYRKESYYFSINHHKGYDWLCSLYKDLAPGKIGADIGPVYYLDPSSVDRILDFNPDTKIVLGVREPVDFAVSLYGNMVKHGFEVPQITEMVKDFHWHLSHKASIQFHLGDEFMRRRIEELQRVFSDNLLLYDFRCFEQSPLAVLQALETFLGIPRHFEEGNFDNVRINASGRHSIGFLSSLLKHQRVLDAIYGIMPQSLLRRARTAFDRVSVSKKPQPKEFTPAVSKEDLAHLQDFFAADSNYFEGLFALHSIQLGSGQPVPPR